MIASCECVRLCTNALQTTKQQDEYRIFDDTIIAWLLLYVIGIKYAIYYAIYYAISFSGM